MATMNPDTIFDPGTYLEGVPHDVFRWLRENDPVRHHRLPNGTDAWSVTRYDDVLTVERDAATYSSAVSGTHIDDLPPEHPLREQMLHQDDPEHRKLRTLVSPLFTPRRVEDLRERIRARAHHIVNGVIERGECDFVTEVSERLPLGVILDLLGVPDADRDQILYWIKQGLSTDDPEYATGQEDQRTEAVLSLMGYASELARSRRQEPRKDIVTLLMQAEVDGEHLSETQFGSFFALLAAAGGDTTRNLITNGLRCLIDHPDQRRLLMDDRTLIPSAVLEMLRYEPSVLHFRRTTTRPAVLGNVSLPAGARVVLWYPSANRDAATFPDPDQFDVRRNPARHLAFGQGPHFCLGAHLAMLETTIMFEVLLERMPDVRLAGPVQRLRDNLMNSVKHMPISFSPGAIQQVATAGASVS